MARFLSENMAQLTRQLLYAPAEQRHKHMVNAERLYWEIETDANYPLAYVIWRLTQTRAELTSENTILVGKAVRRDLMELTERISDSLNEAMANYDPPPLDLETVSKRLGVSAKTISRYRRDGLFAKHLIWPNGRKRIAFPHQSVERFRTRRAAGQKSRRRFSRIDSDTKHVLITRARRIASRAETTPFRVARHLSQRTGRSIEAIRKILIHHDQQDPRTAIFPEHTPPLNSKQQTIIDRAYHRGISVSRLADRFGRARNAIYRAINLRRADRLKQLKIRWVHNPTFDHPDAQEVIMGRRLPDLPDPSDPLVPKMTEPLDAETELALFIRYNYLKHLAHQRIATLDRNQPKSSQLDEVQTILRRAAAAKQRVATSYLKMVTSVATKQLAGKRDQHQLISELQAEGNLVLLETIETFDTARENRFSTYLTWALRRRFFQAIQKDRAPIRIAPPTADSAWQKTVGPNRAALLESEDAAKIVGDLLLRLDERERYILRHHFGLDEHGQGSDPMTLAEVANQLNISAERARQIEHRALTRMRSEARRKGLELPSDILSSE